MPRHTYCTIMYNYTCCVCVLHCRQTGGTTRECRSSRSGWTRPPAPRGASRRTSPSSSLPTPLSLTIPPRQPPRHRSFTDTSTGGRLPVHSTYCLVYLISVFVASALIIFLNPPHTSCEMWNIPPVHVHYTHTCIVQSQCLALIIQRSCIYYEV